MKWAGARALGAVLAFAVLAPREARAMGAVVGPADEAVSIASVRIAVATAFGRTTRWAQISLSSSAAPFVWLVPVQPGARVDLTTDAWLDALDAATVPVIVPPSAPSDCDVPLAPQVIAAATSPSGQSPTQASVALDLSSLTSFVDGAGFAIGANLANQLGEVFSGGEAILALVYAGGSVSPVRTLRMVDTGPATLPFALTGGAAAVNVTAFVLASSSEQAGSSPLTLSPGSVVWLGSGESNYLTVVSSLLASSGDSRWFNQASGTAAFFHSTVVAPSLSLPSVLNAYYTLASKYGDTTADPDACMTSAGSTEDATASYVSACPAGALAVVPGPSPCVGSAEGTPIDPLLCGSVADAALAVADLSPSSVWVTRMVGTVTSGSAADVALNGDGVIGESPVVVAASFDGVCGGGVQTDAGGWEVDGGGDDGGDDGGLSGDDGGVPSAGGDGGVLGDLAAAADGGSSTSEGCDSSGDDSGGGSCDGDSSSDDDSGCGGSSSSSSSDGCSGNNDCMTAKHGHRTKSPLSRVVMMAALALGIRRRLRRRSRPLL
jgi:hypothetical protein